MNVGFGLHNPGAMAHTGVRFHACAVLLKVAMCSVHRLAGRCDECRRRPLLVMPDRHCPWVMSWRAEKLGADVGGPLLDNPSGADAEAGSLPSHRPIHSHYAFGPSCSTPVAENLPRMIAA